MLTRVSPCCRETLLLIYVRTLTRTAGRRRRDAGGPRLPAISTYAGRLNDDVPQVCRQAAVARPYVAVPCSVPSDPSLAPSESLQLATHSRRRWHAHYLLLSYSRFTSVAVVRFHQIDPIPLYIRFLWCANFGSTS